MSETVIKIEDLSLTYETEKTSYQALKNVDLEINKGEFVCLIGSSGCGKSTLLSALEGILEPSEGRVLINGKEVHGAGPERAVVFQNYSLFPWMSARKNVAFAMIESKRGIKKISKREAYKTADEYLAKVGLSEYKDKQPGELSGGMQQRVAIARALITKPAIVLADEPTGNLDSKTSAEVLGLIKRTSAEFRQTVVMITHNNDIARLADRIVRIEDGKIVE